jgi:hypothetical protein
MQGEGAQAKEPAGNSSQVAHCLPVLSQQSNIARTDDDEQLSGFSGSTGLATQSAFLIPEFSSCTQRGSAASACSIGGDDEQDLETILQNKIGKSLERAMLALLPSEEMVNLSVALTKAQQSADFQRETYDQKEKQQQDFLLEVYVR